MSDLENKKTVLSERHSRINFTGNGINAVAAVTYESAYENIIKNLIQKGYAVWILMREARGNTGDLMWKKEYTVVGNGGNFKKMIEKKIGENDLPTYEASPLIRNIPEVTLHNIMEWCCPYDYGCGESIKRMIWLTDSRNRAYELTMYKTPKPPLNHDGITRGKFKNRLDDSYRSFLDCTFFALKEYNGPDLRQTVKKEEPINVSVPDYLQNLKLGDLRCSEKPLGATILQLSDRQIRDSAEKFFSDGTILTTDGQKPAKQEKYQFMCRVIEYGRRLCRIDFANRKDHVSCSAGYFCHCYMEREVSCYDGGNCGTDTMTRELIFRKSKKSWTDVKDEYKEELISIMRRGKDPEQWLRQEKDRWCYEGVLEEENIPVLICRGHLFLLNPFGMEGVFEYCYSGRG